MGYGESFSMGIFNKKIAELWRIVFFIRTNFVRTTRLKLVKK